MEEGLEASYPSSHSVAVPCIMASAAYNANILNSSISCFVYEENYAILGFISLHVQTLLHHTGSIGEIQEFIEDFPA